MTGTELWALFALGVFHGVNPAMGWLFAVSFGLQEGRVGALLRALPAIALGHELGVAVIAVPLALLDATAIADTVRLVGAVVLVAFGGWRFVTRRGHPRWVGMRLSWLELVWWSALMSSAHGAGLMVLPVVTGGTPPEATDHLVADTLLQGVAATAVHTLGMVLAMSVVALVVYRVVGLQILRRAWVNLDRVWAFALVVAGVFTLFT